MIGLTIREHDLLSSQQRSDLIQICYNLRSARNYMAHNPTDLMIQMQSKECSVESYLSQELKKANINMSDKGMREIEGIKDSNSLVFPEIITDRSEFYVSQLCESVFTGPQTSAIYSMGPDLKILISPRRTQHDDMLTFYLASRSYTSRGDTRYTVFSYYRFYIANQEGPYPKGLNYRTDYYRSCHGQTEAENKDVFAGKTYEVEEIISEVSGQRGPSGNELINLLSSDDEEVDFTHTIQLIRAESFLSVLKNRDKAENFSKNVIKKE